MFIFFRSFKFISISCFLAGSFAFSEAHINIEKDHSTNFILRATNSNSLEEAVNKPGSKLIIIKMSAYNECESTLAMMSFIFKNANEFVNNTEFAKTKWEEFLNNNLKKVVDAKFINLKNDDLERKITDCQIQKNKLNIKIDNLEVRIRKENPNFKGLNLELN